MDHAARVRETNRPKRQVSLPDRWGPLLAFVVTVGPTAGGCTYGRYGTQLRDNTASGAGGAPLTAGGSLALGGDSTGGSLPGGEGGSRVSCPLDQAHCSGDCVTLTSDPSHCGACDQSCSNDATCEDGSCRCASGLSHCGGDCVDVRSNPSHCGGCGKPCSAEEFCSRGSCTLACAGALSACGRSCVNLDTSLEHCGACGNTCGPDLTCAHGVCKCEDSGLALCNGLCVDLSDNVDHCGSCNIACSGGRGCTDGFCECPIGETWCGDTCVDVLGDPSNCGNCDVFCLDTQTCTSGSCTCLGATEKICPSGPGEVCSDLQSDHDNCGDCGVVCEGEKECRAGDCACNEGETYCENEFCVDLGSNVAHCGQCSLPCGPSQTCVDGLCTCQGGLRRCGLECLDVQTDLLHCGRCDNQCSPDHQVCVDGTCVDEPCYPAIDLTDETQVIVASNGGCWKTATPFSHLGCWNFAGLTVLVNDVEVPCSEGFEVVPLLAPYVGFYYIEVRGTASESGTSLSWW